MTNKIPIIKVKREIKKISATNPNLKDIVCLVGGFEKEVEDPTFYETLEAAEKELGSDTTIDANKALKEVFHEDITGVLVVDITTHTGAEGNENYSRNVTKTKLEGALNSVSQIDFDLLYVAAELTDELITVITDASDARFEDKRPFNWVGVGTRASESAYTTTANKINDDVAAFLTQPLFVNDEELDLIESGAYLTNLIARLPVGNSLTAKILEEVTGLGTSYTFGAEDLGTKLVGLGFFVVRLVNPQDNTYECVNSAGPNGLDLYINRVRNYIINDFALRKWLGEKSTPATISGIEMECNKLLTKFRNDLGVVENITYAVEKANSNTANVILNTIEFSDIITEIDVFVTIEVV